MTFTLCTYYYNRYSFKKVRTETILKIHTSFTYIFIWVRKLVSNILKKTKN